LVASAGLFGRRRRLALSSRILLRTTLIFVKISECFINICRSASSLLEVNFSLPCWHREREIESKTAATRGEKLI
jgi:hypothetical protein